MTRANLNMVLIVIWCLAALIWLVGGVAGIAITFEHLVIAFLAITLLR